MNFKQVHFFCILLMVVFISCDVAVKYEYVPTQISPINKELLSEEDKKVWYLKDIIDDSIPGISLYKAYSTIINQKQNQEIIVAVIDEVIDINHEDLKSHIWVNSKEKQNNLDDDANGYVDDVNGWDFLGNINGYDNKFQHLDYTRVVKAYDSIFNGKTIHEITPKDSIKFLAYNKAKNKLDEKIEFLPEEKQYADNVKKWKNKSVTNIVRHLGLEDNFKFSIKILDSLKVKYATDSVLVNNIQILSGFLSNGYTDEYIKYLNNKTNELLNKQLNLKYNEREYLGDNPNDINDIKYGSNKVNSNIDIYSHGTIMSGVITKETPEIKIMPLAILGHGDFHDKDLALAISYAVDNGAKVINMSFGKEFSLRKHMVDDALKYAENNNVLIVCSAGNDNINVDKEKKYKFPNDLDDNNMEFVDNFLSVGGSTCYANKELKYKYSNYGKFNIDIFAPSAEIYTTCPNNEYKYDSGTSLASAITSKVAALLFSYYSNLTAPQVKYIIKESGVEYTFPVEILTDSDENISIPFNQLSKSGKIVNAYNALIMADSISK